MPKNQTDHVKRGDDLARTTRILDEIIMGFKHMSKMNHAVSIFGSSRMKRGSQYYHMANDIANALGQEGISIITGGGPGIMEAANKGAQIAKTQSCGLTILLPFEKGTNDYVDKHHSVSFNYFFVRKLMFVKYSSAFIVMPGGLGTYDELFESWTLMQTQRSRLFPIILVGTSFWSGLIDWIQSQGINKGYISQNDMNIIHITDSIDEIKHIVLSSIPS